MDPVDNLALARLLEKQPKGAPAEAAIRGACGRAYYYAYTTVRDVLLAAKHRVPKDGSGHRIAIELLQRSANADVRGAGGLLLQCRTTRNSADYEVGSVKASGMPFIVYRAQVAIANAVSIVEAINKAKAADKDLQIP